MSLPCSLIYRLLFIPVYAQADWFFDAEGGYVWPGYIDVRIPNDTGTLFSLKDDLPAESKFVYRLRLGYRFNPKHSVSVLFAPLSLNAQGSVDKDIFFNGELFPAYTIKKKTHPKSNGWAGTIIESAGRSVYHAGDTEQIPEMKDLAKRNITVALIPCGGTYTMDMEEATDAAMDIQPEIVVPMHSWGADLNKFKEIMNTKDPNIKVEILENKSLKI